MYLQAVCESVGVCVFSPVNTYRGVYPCFRKTFDQTNNFPKCQAIRKACFYKTLENYSLLLLFDSILCLISIFVEIEEELGFYQFLKQANKNHFKCWGEKICDVSVVFGYMHVNWLAESAFLISFTKYYMYTL